MLGVFGCVPACDTYFRKGYKVGSFGKKSLLRVGDFYQENAKVSDRHLVPTLDFSTGEPSNLR